MVEAPIMPREHRFVKEVARALRHRCGVTNGSRWLLAVSGGADSVALLRALHALAPARTWNLRLTVGHVQHHLRPDAEADASFVATLATRLNLPCLRIDLDPAAWKKSGNVEAAARRARYRALTEMARACGAAGIITAHHADDQLETLLMRLTRGTSVRGLRGMAWRRRLRSGDGSSLALVRPMLAVTHAQAVAFLRDYRQPWREDATNADVSRWRARLRTRVLPELRALRSDVAQRAVLLAEHMRQVQRVLDGAVAAAAERVRVQDHKRTFDRTDARTLPTVVLSGLLQRLLRELGAPHDRLGQRTLGPMLRAIHDPTGGRRVFDLPGSVRGIVTRERVIVERTNTDVPPCGGNEGQAEG